MIKKYVLLLPIILMIISWILGIYYSAKYYTPTIILPFFDQYFWVTPFQGLLLTTSIYSIFSLSINLLQLKVKFKTIIGYILLTINNVLWAIIIVLQLKVIAFNLGICH